MTGHMAEMVIESMITGQREREFRYRLLQKNGGWRWVDGTARAFYDEHTAAVRGYVIDGEGDRGGPRRTINSGNRDAVQIASDKASDSAGGGGGDARALCPERL